MKSSEKEFIAEAEEILEESGRLILEMQETFKSGINPDTINALFRAFHTLKGLSSLFGQHSITDISHSLESLLDDIRMGKIEISDNVVGFLFKNMDVLRAAMEGTREQKDIDISEHIKDIENFRNSLEGKKGAVSLKGIIDDSILRTLSEYEEHRLKANVSEGKGIYLIKTVFSYQDFDKALEGLTKKAKSLGELISTLPTSENIPSDSIGFNILLGSLKPVQMLRETLGYEMIELIKMKAGQKPEQRKDVKMSDASLKTTSTTVRVDIEKLDRILNTIGEITLAKGAVRRIGEELADAYGRSRAVMDIHKISQTLDRRLSELQEQVLEIRMVPIGQIFGRLSQVVRRYSREIGKQIELAVFGEDTEIDKYLAEEIIDPLVHIIRNAIDHGIETEEEREKKGKKPVGTVTLKAFQRGNHVVIDARDDGKGMDSEKIRLKALEMGLINKEEELTRRELIELIFMPGFSTSDVVSEVSGRGVGMDIVREKISSIGGFCDVETRKDEGTTVTLTLPITLAIIKALLVRVGTERFAVPLTSISETHVIAHSELKTIEGREVYKLRGEMLPVTRVADVFKIARDSTDRSFAVIVGFGERKIGLLVDELFGQHEIVIKTLGDYLKGLKGFAGAAEIGRHEVILVMDVESVIEESLTKFKGVLNV
jgi:two-component system chemotaxis sensor kinase CheA